MKARAGPYGSYDKPRYDPEIGILVKMSDLQVMSSNILAQKKQVDLRFCSTLKKPLSQSNGSS